MCCSALAVALPFLVITAMAYGALHYWPAFRGTRSSFTLTALAIGLCGTVSALAILVRLVREFGPLRSLGGLAITVAAIDDSALWLGLAVLH